jgi:hypothetical protein
MLINILVCSGYPYNVHGKEFIERGMLSGTARAIKTMKPL